MKMTKKIEKAIHEMAKESLNVNGVIQTSKALVFLYDNMSEDECIKRLKKIGA